MIMQPWKLREEPANTRHHFRLNDWNCSCSFPLAILSQATEGDFHLDTDNGVAILKNAAVGLSYLPGYCSHASDTSWEARIEAPVSQLNAVGWSSHCGEISIETPRPPWVHYRSQSLTINGLLGIYLWPCSCHPWRSTGFTADHPRGRYRATRGCNCR
jgi:hypothetical protein